MKKPLLRISTALAPAEIVNRLHADILRAMQALAKEAPR